MPGGRPCEYTEDKAAAICRRIGDGESLRAICSDDGMPDRHTVFRWLNAFPEFWAQYARARELQVEHWSHEILDIADETTHDTIATDDGERPNNEYMQRSRLRVDTRKWLMSKLAPRVYGDRIEHTGHGGGPLQVQVVKFTDDEPSGDGVA